MDRISTDRRRPILPVTLVVLIVGLAAPAARAAERSASYLAALESINTEELRGLVYYLADDKLEGREAGSRGGRTAGNFVAQRLADLGLAGGGVDGGYFQPFGSGYRNVLARLEGSDPQLRHEYVLVGAHYDHVGYGTRRNSRGGIGQVHNGADDNASGTSGILELAEAFSMLPEAPRRSILFVLWDAEEKGLLGSKYWIAHPTVPVDRLALTIHMDMIGSLRNDELTVFGVRSGFGLRRLAGTANEGLDLRLKFDWDIKANSDHHPFFQRNVPFLLLHTGLHDYYHTPRDDAFRINPDGMRRVVRLLFGMTYDMANQDTVPGFRDVARRESESTRRGLARLRPPQRKGRFGVTWDPKGTAEGLALVRVEPDSPAARAGLVPGDRIVRFDGRPVQSTEDLIGAVATAPSPAIALIRRSGAEEPKEISVALDGKPVRLGVTWRVDPAAPGTVILTRVVPGTPAAQAGLAVGDRIYQIAGRDFAGETEFAELAGSLPGPFSLLVERHGRVRTVEVTFGDEAVPAEFRRAA